MKSTEENKNKKGLGRGIGSLLGGMPSVSPEKGEETATTPMSSKDNIQIDLAPRNRIWNVAVEKLKPSPFQPRQVFKKEELEELSNSIRQKGVLQPIIARKDGEAFEIIAGERRWRAAQMAGLHEVPVILKTFDDLETLELAIIENVQRADLNPIEEAEAYQRLATQFDLSQSQIAEKVGKDRATVANALRLLQLPLIVREMVQNNLISQGHAKVLLGLSDEKQQIQLAKKCAAESLSVRKLESLIKSLQNPKVNQVIQEKSAIQAIQNIQEKLIKKMNTKVNIQYQNGKGHLTIYFYQKEQFSELIETLLK
jgi:ParB family chromosome partitioning protein